MNKLSTEKNMQEKIIEIIVFLINEMRNNKRLGEIDLRILSDHGYTENEISTAFSWLFDKINLGENILANEEPNTPHSYRILHDAERSIITPDAQGYLIQLRELGLLDESAVETLIDRVMMTGFSKVDLMEMKILIASLLFDYDDSNHLGSRLMLNSKDTIH